MTRSVLDGVLDWQTNDDGELKAITPDGREAIWAPQPGSQEAFLRCPLFECLYEGTRGPGKTDALLMDFCQHVGPDTRSEADKQAGLPQMAGWGAEWRGILFRQTFPQLADVIAKSKKWFPQLWPGAKFNEAKTTWVWPTGETLRFSYIQRKDDYWSYHGHAYPWIGFEELTTWPDYSCYTVMFSCSRSTKAGMPRKIRATANPYGPGHNWVKHRFRLPVTPGKVIGRIIEEKNEPPRTAVHGHIDENRILLTADPSYKDRIRAAARNQSELAAWLEGSWDIVAGGMFDDVWDPKVHVMPNFAVPSSWRIDRSFDWGSSAPFSVGWWAESDGSDLELPDGRVISTVRGDLFRIYEWYGWTGEPNEGVKMLAKDVARGIRERELRWGLHGRVKAGPADTSIFNVENGMSIGADMAKSVRINGEVYKGISWTEADKRPGSRKTGWEMMRKMLQAAKRRNGLPREEPGLFVCERCEQFIRTVPVLPRDQNKDPDDVDTDAEDHVADEVRYRVRHVGNRMTSGRVIGAY